MNMVGVDEKISVAFKLLDDMIEEEGESFEEPLENEEERLTFLFEEEGLEEENSFEADPDDEVTVGIESLDDEDERIEDTRLISIVSKPILIVVVVVVSDVVFIKK